MHDFELPRGRGLVLGAASALAGNRNFRVLGNGRADTTIGFGDSKISPSYLPPVPAALGH
jgi:hypothetical protein